MAGVTWSRWAPAPGVTYREVVRSPLRHRHRDEVVRITAAPRAHHDDQHARIVRYTLSMSIRVVCLVLAFVTTGPLQWVMVAGAVVLPYIAVVMANAGRERTADPAAYTLTAPTVTPLPPRSLPAAAPHPDAAPPAPAARPGPATGTVPPDGFAER